MLKYTASQRLVAYSVHLFTSSGILSGFMAILAINAHNWRAAMFWLFICQLIDGIDGTFARLFKVSDVLPHMNGKDIDQVIDFATYAIIPAYFLYQSELVPETWRLTCAFIMLLAAAMYYGKEGMISDDMHFIGFPVMWNVVVYFLFFVFRFPPVLNGTLIGLFAILHFVPLRYPYPSRMLKHQKITLALSAVALVATVAAIWIYPVWNIWLSAVTVVTLAWYAYLTLRSSLSR